jgi:hypothetical protein
LFRDSLVLLANRKQNSTVVVVAVAAVAVVVVVVRAFITTLLQSYYHTNCSVSGVFSPTVQAGQERRRRKNISKLKPAWDFFLFRTQQQQQQQL